MENKLDNLFKSQLSKFEETPSHGAWDQIHEKLASKRKAIWVKRIAIAASLILIATVGFLGYRYTEKLNIETVSEVVSIVEEKNEILNDTSTDVNTEEGLIERADKITEDKTQVDKVEDLQKDLAQAYSGSDKELAKPVNNAKEEVEQNGMLIATSIGKREPVTSIAIEEVLQDNGDVIAGHDEKVDMAKLNDREDVIEPKKQKAKVYPKVRIVYKANQDSELVASERKTIIDRGINKITEFSDEHLLTNNRKTKLRNTKDDLLALNFGKLLNKSNRDLEN